MRQELAPDDEIEALHDADSVAEAVQRVWRDPLAARGVIHAVEALQGDRGRYLALSPQRQAPRSRHGSWVTSLARARADAVLTTAGMLRQAPALDHRLVGPGQLPEALAAWREKRLGKSAPPVTLVFTTGDLPDLEHPVFHHSTRALIYTSRQAQWQLESRAADHGIEVVGVEEPTAVAAVEFLRHAFGAATITVEAEPAVAGDLYESPSAVDELMLAVCRAPHMPPDAVLGPFLSAEHISRSFPWGSKPYRVATDNDEWSLHRFQK